MHTEDQLILVDLDDVPIGSAGKAEVHRRGLLHRAFSIFLTDGERMLLQRRSRGKYHSGGLWANACCSHPRAGESLEQAVPRRLKEELGISCPVEELFSFHYFSQYGPQLFEYELDHVFLGRWSGPVCPDPEEIEETRWVPFSQLRQELVECPARFSTWFLIAAPRVLERLAPPSP